MGPVADRRLHTRLFLTQARLNFLHTGAIAPSSRFLARAMSATLDSSSRGGGPLTVLEAGAGTGALTVEIVRRLPPGSHLDIYEVNPTFAQHLDRTFRSNGRVEVRVVNEPVQAVPDSARYDAIISGLPLNNFKPAIVKAILKRLFATLRPGGSLSYFEYLLIRELKSLATGPRERRRLRRVGRVTGSYLEKYEFRREAVFLNIPPAVVHHLRKPD